jgi:Protein of unknown function (DUF4058)
MPLRDHFREPNDRSLATGSLHAGWTAMIIPGLKRILPPRYQARPGVRRGGSVQYDVGTFDRVHRLPSFPDASGPDQGEVAVTPWTPPRATLALASDLRDPDQFEVQVFDTDSGIRLVAVVELVSPANKDRPEDRRAFAAKCAALLQARISVAIVDVVTSGRACLYLELLRSLGLDDPGRPVGPHAAACRWAGGKGEEPSMVETWAHPLAVGRALPTLPLWLDEDLAVPLDLEESYEETCRLLYLR